MLHLRSLKLFQMLKFFQIDLVNRISSERKVKNNVGTSKFKYAEGPLGDVLRTSQGRLRSTSHGRPLNVRLGRILDVISGCPQEIRLGHPQHFRSGRPRDSQIRSLGDVLGTLRQRGKSSGRSGDQYWSAGLLKSTDHLFRK